MAIPSVTPNIGESGTQQENREMTEYNIDLMNVSGFDSSGSSKEGLSFGHLDNDVN